MSKTLDKQKPYGTVHGDDTGRCFIQDGTYFDAAGQECAPLPADPAPAEATDATEPAKPKKK